MSTHSFRQTLVIGAGCIEPHHSPYAARERELWEHLEGEDFVPTPRHHTWRLVADLTTRAAARIGTDVVAITDSGATYSLPGVRHTYRGEQLSRNATAFQRYNARAQAFRDNTLQLVSSAPALIVIVDTALSTKAARAVADRMFPIGGSILRLVQPGPWGLTQVEVEQVTYHMGLDAPPIEAPFEMPATWDDGTSDDLF